MDRLFERIERTTRALAIARVCHWLGQCVCRCKSNDRLHWQSQWHTLLLLALVLGCGEQKPGLKQAALSSGELPGARSSQHPGLRAALRDVEASVGLPKDLKQPPLNPNQNASVVLMRDFAPAADLDELATDAEELLAALPDADPGAWRTEARTLLDDRAHALATAKAATELPGCNFMVDFSMGYFNHTQFVDTAAVACRLQLIEAALAAENDDLVPAIELLKRAWKWCDWLAAEKILEARLQATRLRTDVFAVLRMLAADQRMDVAKLKQLAAPLGRTLSAWPSDRELLVGERALAMHAYEMVRQGYIENILTFDERRLLDEEQVLDQFTEQPPADQIDDDETQYLNYLARVITLTDRPFHERSSELREFDRILSTRSDGTYAWLANRVFGAGLTQGQAELARSQAQVLGWHTALLIAAGEPPDTMPVSPFNGVTLVAETAGDDVIVRLDDRRVEDPRARMAGG